MKQLFVILLLVFPVLARAQQHGQQVTVLSKNSIRFDYSFDENWRFHAGDSDVMANPGYDDSQWELVNPSLYFRHAPKKESEKFSGIGWLRLHIWIDSSIATEPLALTMTHLGASEVYVDGKKIISFGIISGPEHSKYVDPRNIPFVLPYLTPGAHVLAVRYANYKALYNYEVRKKNFPGFRMSIGRANTLIRFDHRTATRATFIFIILFGIFIALSLLHFFLYLYHRTTKSNLYFSIFCISIAFLFYVPFLMQFSTNVATQLNTSQVIVMIISLACFSFSGFNNELFGKKRSRFKIVIALGIIAPFLMFFNLYLSSVAYISLIIFVSIEAVILTIKAIYRKVKGARIIGVGILFLALFFLVVMTIVIFTDNLSFNDNSTAGLIFSLFGAAAILSLPISMSVYLAWSFASINKDLTDQLENVKVLSERSLVQEQEKKQLLENRKEELEKEVVLRTEEVTSQKREIEKQHEELKSEKKKSDDLLLNILPEEVAEELKQKGSSEAKFFDHVTVLFTDFVDFTKAGERMSPQELVDELHTCFKAFDDIVSQYGIEKIKTIGDAYLAVGGLPIAQEEHAINVVKAAREIRQFMTARKQAIGDNTFEIRIGIHSGSVVAGIVGVKKFAYDIWGDTVNTAARMEQHGEKGKINISQATYELVKDRFVCTNRGAITAKNKGELSMYFVEREN
jgi:adenylate cyclase